MSRLFQPIASEMGNTSAQLPGLSRRQALAGFGFTLGAASFATPALAQKPAPPKGEKTLGHTRNKRLVANFLDAMALPDTMAALRQYCHVDCHFEVFHPFNTLVGVEAADAAFWKPKCTAYAPRRPSLRSAP